MGWTPALMFNHDFLSFLFSFFSLICFYWFSPSLHWCIRQLHFPEWLLHCSVTLVCVLCYPVTTPPPRCTCPCLDQACRKALRGDALAVAPSPSPPPISHSSQSPSPQCNKQCTVRRGVMRRRQQQIVNRLIIYLYKPPDSSWRCEGCL